MILRRVGVWPAARITGAIYAALGVLFGALVTVGSLVAALFGSASADGFGGVFVGIFGVVMVPVIYGALGLAVGALTAALYNWFADLLGGIELELESRP